MYGKIKYKQLSLRATLRGIGGEVIVKKFSYNILDNARREQIPLKRFGKVYISKVKFISHFNLQVKTSSSFIQRRIKE